MQKYQDFAEYLEITPATAIEAPRHGWRAKCLQRLIRLDMPVPKTVALSCDTVRAIAAGTLPATDRLIEAHGALIEVRIDAVRELDGSVGAAVGVPDNDEIAP